MSTHALHGGTDALPRPELHLAGLTAVAGLIILGLGALAGGIALVSAPDGSNMQFDVGLLAGSPFSDYLIPGLILGGLFGIGSLVVAAMGLLHSRIAPFLALSIGCAQMVWIVVELAIIQEFSFLHPAMFLLGFLIAVASVPWGWPTFQAWREAR